MKILFVPAGEFVMGSIEGLDEEKPAHKIYLDAFWINKYEVTNAMYEMCVNSGACRQPHSSSSFTIKNYYGNPRYADYPVVYIDWEQAMTYCQWAGGSLLTEAEWEKAARGSDPRIFPWGDQSVDGMRVNFADASTDYRWSNHNINDGFKDTAPVGSFPMGESPYGVLDMAGNVWEWVFDWYDENYYNVTPSSNPYGPDSGVEKVLKGGSFNDSITYLRSNARFKYDPDDWMFNFGIRCGYSSPP